MRWDSVAVVELDGLQIRCRATDLSLGGIAMISQWQVRTGRSVGVRFCVEGKPAYARGVVAWSHAVGDRHVWGVRFTTAHPSCMRRLFSFLRTHLAPTTTVKHAKAEKATTLRLCEGVPCPAALAPTVRHELGPAMDPDAGVPIAVSSADDSPRPLYWAAV